ncbi:MAG: hypothetical protein AAF936_03870 [Pseudomonadota bacterium]
MNMHTTAQPIDPGARHSKVHTPHSPSHEAYYRYVDARTAFLSEKESVEKSDAAFDNMLQAADDFLSAPVPSDHPWLLAEKYALFEKEVFDDSSNELFCDRREIRWIGSLKADALTLARELEHKSKHEPEDIASENCSCRESTRNLLGDVQMAQSALQHICALLKERDSGISHNEALGIHSILEDQIQRLDFLYDAIDVQTSSSKRGM